MAYRIPLIILSIYKFAKTMLKKLLILTAAFMTALAPAATSQNRRTCGTMEVLERLQREDPSMERRMREIETQTSSYIQEKSTSQKANYTESVVTIPVVFHVIYNTTAQNISDAQCIAQLNQLNLDFARLNADASNTPSAFQSLAANTNIQFCIARRDPNGNATTGIQRRQTTVSAFSTNDNMKQSANGGLDAWPASSYLNIWVCNMSGGILGYAQFPGGSAATDGVVLLYSTVGSVAQPGTAAPYNKGRTATHEVGHWLNLRHIWGDDGTGCSGSDQVGDTPNQAGENYGCPSYPRTDGCTAASPGVMFMNYMDYTDDGCMNLFTLGQSSRMNALFGTGGARAGLLTSTGCTPPTGGTTCGNPSSLAASGITASGAALNWNAVSGASGYNVQYRVNGSSTWTTITSATNSRSLSGLTSSTTYNWQVQAVCSGASSAYVSGTNFTTLSSSGCTDAYESNNTSGTARAISTNSDINALISSSTDRDWFRFTTTSPNTNIRINLTNLPADYDIRLYNSSLSQLAISQNGGTTSETITRNTSSAGTYYIQVYGYNGASNASTCYKLRVNVGSTAFRLAEEGLLVPETDIAINELVLYPNPARDMATLAFNAAENGMVSLKLFDMLGKVYQVRTLEAEAGINKVDFNVSELSKGIYFVELTNQSDRQLKKLIIER